MKRILMLGAAVMFLSAAQAEAADPLTLQLKWVAQAQFAGYYVAAPRAFTRSPIST